MQQKSRLIYSNGTGYFDVQCISLSARLSASMKMMMVQLIKHGCLFLMEQMYRKFLFNVHLFQKKYC